MNTTDLERCVEQLRRGAPTRHGLRQLWRRQQPGPAASAEDCMKIGRDAERKLEPMRRRQGAADAA